MKKKPYYWIGSAEKSLKIIEILAQKGELSVSRIAAHLDSDRSAVFRFLATLRDMGYLVSESGNYRLSMKFFEIGMSVDNVFEVKRIAMPFMQELADLHNETVNLARIVESDIIYIEKVNSNSPLRLDLAVGTRVPAHCSALGKAILAFKPEADIEAMFTHMDLNKFTPYTIDSFESLNAHLMEVREQGYAVDDREYDQHLRCVAAPVFDYLGSASYAISLAGPASRMDDKRIESIAEDVKQVAAHMSDALGNRRSS